LIHSSARDVLGFLNSNATVIQSLFRGYLTRKYTFFPTSSLSFPICRLVNDFIQSNKNRVFTFLSAEDQSNNFLIKWDCSEKLITFVVPKRELVGSGFWKKCFSCTNFYIKLINKDVEVVESVWMTAGSDFSKELKIQEFLYDKFTAQSPEDVFLLRPWERIHEKFFTQKRLISISTQDHLQSHTEKVECLKNLSKTLAWMHEQEVIHGDVHLKNLLMEEQIDPEGYCNRIFYLSDFGSSRFIGVDQDYKMDNYVRWDICKCLLGANTPLLDWHGFMVTAIALLIDEEGSRLKWEQFILVRDAVLEDEYEGRSSGNNYWVGSNSFNQLSRLQRNSWSLFISSCQKSAHLYRFLKEIGPDISEEDLKKGLAETNALEVRDQCLAFVEELTS
jgi:thiamine kinase-like enzyme